jgi:hypothetical protein
MGHEIEDSKFWISGFGLVVISWWSMVGGSVIERNGLMSKTNKSLYLNLF